jgi:cyclopropane fatty-acyl-phospholipid synthase-like methyltransferase
VPLDRRLFEGKIQSSVIYPGFFPIHTNERVVNFGCGVGPQAVTYKAHFAEMVGIDLHQERLAMSQTLLAEREVTNYRTICAPVEKTGLPNGTFQKALAIDIIEHLPDPAAFLAEAYRVLTPGGEMLVTVPAMHDHYVHAARAIARCFGRKTVELPSGHLDAHNSAHSLGAWKTLATNAGFHIVRTRASTLWPPLHLYGVPRFWFTNRILRSIDDFLCALPIFKWYGQAYLMVLRKP